MSNISEKLNENIEKRLDEIANLKTGSDEMSAAIGEIVKLHKLRMDELRNESEDSERRSKSALETQKYTSDELSKDEDLKERKKERWFKVGIAAAEIILPLATYGVLAYIGYAREFDGIITSDTLKRVLTSIKKK